MRTRETDNPEDVRFSIVRRDGSPLRIEDVPILLTGFFIRQKAVRREIRKMRMSHLRGVVPVEDDSHLSSEAQEALGPKSQGARPLINPETLERMARYDPEEASEYAVQENHEYKSGRGD